MAEISLTLADIAAQLGGELLGDPETRISRAASLSNARAGEIAFLANPKYRGQLATCAASAVILRPEVAAEFSGARLVTANPYAYYARVAQLLHAAPLPSAGVHPSAVLASDLPASVSVGPNACIGQGVLIGENVRIGAGVWVGDGARVGQGSVLHSNVSIYPDCQIGERCIIHSGAVVGSDGFGFAPDGDLWIKIPQIGRVLIGDDVEIGANTAIDRGALEDTLIGNGCKIDNLVHIAHNCRIGANTVLAGCTGIAGSTQFGEHCVVGGAAMISGHLSIAAGTTISGGSTLMKSIARPGVYTSVFPIDAHDEWLRNASHIRRLAKLADRVAELEKMLKAKE